VAEQRILRSGHRVDDHGALVDDPGEAGVAGEHRRPDRLGPRAEDHERLVAEEVVEAARDRRPDSGRADRLQDAGAPLYGQLAVVSHGLP
jgi:hypothetical protein